MAPEMILTSVLLPAPLSPSRQTTSPLPTVKVPSSSAVSAPYDFCAPVDREDRRRVRGATRRASPRSPKRRGAGFAAGARRRAERRRRRAARAPAAQADRRPGRRRARAAACRRPRSTATTTASPTKIRPALRMPIVATPMAMPSGRPGAAGEGHAAEDRGGQHVELEARRRSSA